MHPTDLARFLKAYSREPSTKGVGKEPLLARWLQNQRSYFKRTGRVNEAAESCLALAGFPVVLRKGKKESASNQGTLSIVNWVSTHGREPSRNSRDPQEASIGKLLERRRSRGSYLPSDVAIVAQKGFPNLFYPKGREDLSNNLALAFCWWVQTHNSKLPDRRSRDPLEARVANWYWNKKAVNLGNIQGTVYSSDLKLLEAHNLAYLLAPEPSQSITNKIR